MNGNYMSNPMIYVALALLPLMSNATFAGNSGNWKAERGEVINLPRFCWAQYLDDVHGPEFSMPPRNICGPGMNHYCPGLLDLMDAKRSVGSKSKERKGHLYRAKKRTLYTLRAMEKYPQCPIRSHAESTLAEIEAMSRIGEMR